MFIKDPNTDTKVNLSNVLWTRTEETRFHPIGEDPYPEYIIVFYFSGAICQAFRFRDERERDLFYNMI